MRARLFLLFILLLGMGQLSIFNFQLSIGEAFAQPVPKKVKPWQWGIEGGVDVSRFRASKELFSPDNRVGWLLGLKLKTGIPLPNLGLDAALLYNQNHLEYETNSPGYYRNKKIHMFVVPVNLRYNWKLQERFVIYLASGPQWNWLLDKSRFGETGKLDHSFFDWNIGMGFDVMNHVQLGFNYNIPLGRMGEVNNVNLEGHTWNIRAAYYF